MSSFFFGSRRAIAGCCSAVLLFVSVASVLAADVRDLTQDNTALQKIRELSLGFQGVSDADFAGVVRRALNFDNSADLRLEKSTRLPNGKTILRFEQTYLGIPMWGQRVLVTKKADGSVQALGGEAIYNFGLNFKPDSPKLSEDAALAKATEAARRLPGGDTLADLTDTSIREVIYVGKTGLAVPSFEVSFTASTTTRPEGEMRPFVILNSSTGEALLSWDAVVNARATGPGGNRKTGRIIYGKGNVPFLDITKRRNKCYLKSENVTTEDMRNATKGTGKPFSFKCGKNNENTHRDANGAYSPMNDAQFFGQVVFDMYQTWYGTRPLKFPLRLRVHFGKNYNNAFWNGKVMTFGDGGKKLYPLVSLDVTSHEVSHGFTHQNSRLIYKEQSGGINESFSDMAGKAAEAFADEKYGLNYTKSDLRMGSEIFKKKGTALRYMCDPPKDGRSIAHVRDYKPGMNVHHSSGVFNKAYCRLAKTPNWSVKKAFHVFVVANQNYWTPDASFSSAARDVLAAAQALDYNVNAIRKAFLEVGINLEPGTGILVADASEPRNNETGPVSICSYLGDALLEVPKSIKAPESSSEAIAMIQKIVDASGLTQNFDVSAASVPNAAALIRGRVRHVLYNPTFIHRIASDTGTKWAPISVLAHEVGHHLNAHTLAAAGSPQLELEADSFSGFMLQRLGASQEDATAVIAKFGTDSGSPTHPSKQERIAAIRYGWTKACKKDPDCFLEPLEPGEPKQFDDGERDYSVPSLGEAECNLAEEDFAKEDGPSASPWLGNDLLLHQQ